MDLADLVAALFRDDILAARQWVKDAARTALRYAELPRPDLDERGIAAAAGLVEMLAERADQPAPEWSKDVPPAPEDVWLDSALRRVPVLRERCVSFAPRQLRSRRVYALPGFLSVP